MYKTHIRHTLRIAFGISMLAILLAGAGVVEAETGLPGVLQIPATGMHFELNNSEYLNITLDSSEPIKLSIESIPKIVTMHLESINSATSTQIILRGFVPLTTYQKYEDSYRNQVTFTTDDSGKYAYTQDLTKPHFIFIQPETSTNRTGTFISSSESIPVGTKFINDGLTGGDCTIIGIWTLETKTCTLTTDLTDSIEIDSSEITLDGNGHTISNIGIGVSSNGHQNTIKNLNIKDSSYGILCQSFYGGGNSFVNNNITSNSVGIFVGYDSYSDSIVNSTINSNGVGIRLYNDIIGPRIDNNTIKYNGLGISLTDGTNDGTIVNNIIESNGLGIRFCDYYTSWTYNKQNHTIFNNYFNNTNNYEFIVPFDGIIYRNKWNTTKIFGINIVGGPFIGGNFWGNTDGTGVSQNCPDLDQNGICDIPYILDIPYGNSIDNLPLSLNFTLDLIEPVTIIELFGIQGNNYWFTSNVHVTLTASDNEGGYGVSKTEYSLDNSVSWIEYSEPFTIYNEGTTTLFYRSIDNAGNVEPTKTQMVYIDKTLPSSITNLTNSSYSQNYINWSWTEPKDIDFDKVMIYLNGNFQTNATNGTQYYIAIGLTANTMYELETRTIDIAGNINETKVNHSARTAPLPTIRFINGTVKDNSTGNNLTGVTVSANSTLSKTTDETGFYSFAVTNGSYNLISTYDIRFYTNTTTVSTIGQDVVWQDIELVKKPTGNITGSVIRCCTLT